MSLDHSRRGLALAGILAGSFALSGSASAAETAVQQDIGDYLMKAIELCWAPPVGTRSVARIQISLNKDGSLAGPPKILGPVMPSPDKVAESAARAVTRCAPFSRLTSYAAHYDLWRDVVLTFKLEDTQSDGPAAVDADDLKKLMDSHKKAK